MAKTEWKQTDGKVVSVASMNTRGRLQFIVGFTYEVEGETYQGKFYTFDLTRKGDPVMVKYDVSIPSENNLAARQRRINWIAALVAVPILGRMFTASLVQSETVTAAVLPQSPCYRQRRIKGVASGA